MTTIVATQRALEFLSMSNQQERRRSKRLAAAERDDDFEFVRKRPRTEEPDAASRDRSKTTKTATGAADRTHHESSVSIATKGAATSSSATAAKAGRRSSRRDPGNDDSPDDSNARIYSRKSTKPPAEGKIGAEDARQSDDQTKAARTARRWEPSPTPRRPVESSKIYLPMSDTPIINRNKEMRKQGGKSNRRSSLGSRGRRASSLIENGQTATPHPDVNPSEYYKHVGADLVETRRMKQVLMWCGERAMPPKPPHGTTDANAILAARPIQQQISKDFATRSDFSDWFSRDEGAPKAPASLKPNPRNIELDEKLITLEARIQRLREEKQAWQALGQSAADIPPLYSGNETDEIVLPEINLLEPEEVRLRGYLADEMVPFATVRSKAEERLRRIQSSLEFEVDQLADNVHKLEQRVLTAGRQADKVLKLSSLRLKEREQREKTSAGTRDMPMMEVLRSLSNILPEGNGG